MEEHVEHVSNEHGYLVEEISNQAVVLAAYIKGQEKGDEMRKKLLRKKESALVI